MTTLKHGHNKRGKRNPTYNSWAGMIQRCRDTSHSKYARYGARGISVCDRWLEYTNFLTDMGERPDGTTLDRIDNALGYNPENCRWATKSEQMRNTDRALTFEGKPIAQWAEETGVSYQKLKARLRDRGTLYLKRTGNIS